MTASRAAGNCAHSDIGKSFKKGKSASGSDPAGPGPGRPDHDRLSVIGQENR